MRAKSAIVAENSEVVDSFVLLLNRGDLFILKFSRSEEANDIRNINVETTALGGIPNLKKYSLNRVQRRNLTKKYFIDLF